MPKHIHCPHFSICSGCSIDEFIDHPPVFREAQDYFKSKGIDHFILNTGAPIGWRVRAKLAVRGTAQHPLIGLYQEGTHHVIDIPLCKIHHLSINKAVEIVKDWMRTEHLNPYQETTFQGVLRYVQMVVERSTGKVQLTLVINSSFVSRELQDSLKNLWEKGIGLWHSLWVNFNERRDNVIFGNQWQLIQGENVVWENLVGTEICFHPSSFGQANLDVFETMLIAIQRHILPQAHLTEFYAGSGAIGLSMAAQCASVRCCEVNPGAEECFKASRDKLNPFVASKISFECGSVKNKLYLLEGADAVLVDPPRKGLEPLLLKALTTTKARQLIYVSCGWDSFQRDCDTLLQAGWNLKHAEAYLFFPGSNHIETLAILQK